MRMKDAPSEVTVEEKRVREDKYVFTGIVSDCGSKRRIGVKDGFGSAICWDGNN